LHLRARLRHQRRIMPPDHTLELACLSRGLRRIAGVDEAGRGPLAGPVVAAAVVLDPAVIPPGLDDSKKLTAKRREALFDVILASAQVGIGISDVEEIDRINILEASLLAMERAIAALPEPADHCLIDGNIRPRNLIIPCDPVVKGDAISVSIAAASIIAKVTRDRIMVGLAQQHPGYGWERNMGYGAAMHLSGLRDLGITPHHRRSFAPIHKMLCREDFITS
jgi:ribonuclease HII